MKKPPKERPFPTKEQVLDFIRESPTPVGKREIARAFHILGDRRVELKALLKELESSGAIEKGGRRRVAPPASLPEIGVLEVTEIDPDGELLARPTHWDPSTEPPKILMAPAGRGHPALAVGERVLARMRRVRPDVYEATVVRVLGKGPAQVLGVFEPTRDGGGRLVPTDRRQKSELVLTASDAQGLTRGDIVLADVLPSSRLGLRRASVTEKIGRVGDAKVASLLAIHAHEIPHRFPDAAVAEAEAAAPPILGERVDLRDVPLVTIDGPDARDFDDAVWAEPDTDNPGGWHLIVAIADVANYVRPGSALDREAFERGNSVYFPDRVVPMLPEALSNGLCSLRPNEDRACLAAHLWIDARGQLLRHRFVRGLMRSAARLTYEQVQAARNGAPDELTAPLLDNVIAPLYGAYEALAAARTGRGTLELDLPERKVILDDEGTVTAIVDRERLDSHRLIEEFMILANVAAAETLEAKKAPCLYRIHDEPAPERLEALRDFLDSLGYNLAKGQVLKPQHFTQILDKAAGTPESHLVSTVVLRAQAQAVYSPDNIGHFGLALRRYAHFTSPIRRYADLIVHRSLIRALGLGPDGLDDETAARLEEIGVHISMTERRAAAAERDALDRYVAAFLADRIGSVFSGRIGGVTRFGLFVTLSETGADGLVPISTLPDDYYEHDEANHALVGTRWGRVYRLGDPVTVRLVEADPIKGSTLFALMGDKDPSDEDVPPSRRPTTRPGARPGGRPPPRGKSASRRPERPGRRPR